MSNWSEQIGYEELATIINEIDNGASQVTELLNPSIKEYFKSLLLEAGDATIILESIGSRAPLSSEGKPILDFATDTILHIHQSSKEVLTTLLDYAGLTQKQIQRVNEACSQKEKSIEKSVCHLFEAEAFNLPLINYPKNKILLSIKKKDDGNDNLGDNSFDAFVRYLVSNGVPSVILEELARLTIYQKLQFKEDLTTNLKFQNIYNTFIETGKIRQEEITYSKRIIDSSILNNCQKYPIQITTENGGIPVAKYKSDAEIIERWVGKRAPASFFDAWGVKEGVLHIYCVTNQYSFENQDIQVVNDAYGIENGMLKGELEGISDYQIIGLCNPLIGESHDEFLNFSEQLREMMRDGSISKFEFNSLKYSPVNKEILKIINGTADLLYEKIKGHISMGLHSDNTIPIKLKSKEIQVSTSINGIASAINVLRKISERNPALHQIDTAFSTYAKDLAEAYRLAHAAIVLNTVDSKLQDTLDQAEEDLVAIKKCMIANNNRHAQEVIIAVEPKAVVKSSKRDYNDTYAEQQDALINNRLSIQEELKLKTGTHQVTFDSVNKASVQVLVSQIVNNTYNGPITQSLLNDLLLFKIGELKKSQENSPNKNINMHSYKTIVKGMALAIDKGFDVSIVIESIKNYPDLDKKLLENRNAINNVDKINSVMRITNKNKP